MRTKMGGYGLPSFGSEYGSAARVCKYGNGTSGSIKCGDFVQLIKKQRLQLHVNNTP